MRFSNMPDACFSHDRYGYGLHNLFNDQRVSHSGHASGSTDIRGNPFQSHDGHSPGGFSDLGLLRVDYIHDNSALLHLGHTALYG